MFRTMDELYNVTLEAHRVLLAQAEEAYYQDFSHAISAIHHAYAELVCYGEKEVWFGDMMLESALVRAINTEQYYNAVKQQYDDVIELVRSSVS